MKFIFYKIIWLEFILVFGFFFSNCRSLAENPWECTCSLKEFHDKLLELETSSGLVLVDRDNIRCSNLMNVPMLNLTSRAHWCKYPATLPTKNNCFMSPKHSLRHIVQDFVISFSFIEVHFNNELSICMLKLI